MTAGYSHLTPSLHFVQRCNDRGIVKSDVTALYLGMVWAATEGKDKYCEAVKKDPVSGRQWYRFRSLDGFVYALMDYRECGKLFPVTIFTQEQWRKKRKSLKFLKNKCRSPRRYAKG